MNKEVSTDNNPYVGPEPFKVNNTLYGRDREAAELLDLLIAERIVLVYSPSGAGKTSLIQAKMLKMLLEADFQERFILRVSQESKNADGKVEIPSDTNRYIFSLLLGLEDTLPKAEQQPLNKLAEMKLAEYLARRTHDFSNKILIIDQFEEILTLNPADRDKKEEFFKQLGQALQVPYWWALLAMQEEFFGGLEPYRAEIPTRLSNTYRLELLGEKAALDAIQKPAKDVKVTFEYDAAYEIFNDLQKILVPKHDGSGDWEPADGSIVEPMLLQVVCFDLWKELQPQESITAADLKGRIDPGKILANFYKNEVEAVAGKNVVEAVAGGSRDKEGAIRLWFEHQLITEQGVRGQVMRGKDQTQGLENKIIDKLVKRHLVRVERRHGNDWYELAHDRLIGPIKNSNAEWLQKYMSPLQYRAKEWWEHHQGCRFLIVGQPLEELEAWAREHPAQMRRIPDEKFLDACREKDRIEREKERADIRKTRWFAAVMALLALCAIFLLVSAIHYYLKAQSRILAEAATADLVLDPERSLLQAIDGALFDRNPEVENALQLAIHIPAVLLTVSHKGRVAGLAFSKGGVQGKPLLATASFDGSAKVYDLSSGKDTPDQILKDEKAAGDDKKIQCVALSPDGKYMATGSKAGMVKVWSLDSHSLKWSPIDRPDQGEIRAVAFDPQDANRLATAGSDGTVKLWNIDNYSSEPKPIPHDAAIWGMAFSPDGKWLATAGEDKLVKVWDVNDTKKPIKVLLHEELPRCVAFSPNGRFLAAGCEDLKVRVWDLPLKDKNPHPAYTLGEHSNTIFSVAFGYKDDILCLATASADGTAGIWEAASGKRLVTLHGHRGPIQGVVFCDKGRVATASRDKTAKLWDFCLGHTDIASSVAWHPDGKRFASASYDHTIKVWEVESAAADGTKFKFNPRKLQYALPAMGEVECIAFSPNGQFLAGASKKNLEIWKTDSPDTSPTRLRETWDISSFAFIKNSGYLAVAKYDETISIWNFPKGSKLEGTFEGHEKVGYAVTVSSNGTRLATVDREGLVKIWDGERTKKLLWEEYHGGKDKNGIVRKDEVPSIAMSQDGKLLATGGLDCRVVIWDVEKGEKITFLGQKGEKEDELTKFFGPVSSLAFRPDGKQLIAGSWDRTAVRWSIEGKEFKKVASYRFPAGIQSIAWSPDMNKIAVACDNFQAYVYWMDFKEVENLAKLKNRSSHRLMEEVREKYLTENPLAGFWLKINSWRPGQQ